jgi:hypothetical protein
MENIPRIFYVFQKVYNETIRELNQGHIKQLRIAPQKPQTPLVIGKNFIEIILQFSYNHFWFC